MNERSAEAFVGGCFVVSTLAALGLAAVYVGGGQPQAEGALLAVSLGGIGVGIVGWARAFLPHDDEVQERDDLASPHADRAGFAADVGAGRAVLGRRRFLAGSLGAAFGALGLAALFPIWSLGPEPGRTLFRTAWRRGSRLVTADGRPVRLGDLAVGGFLTVFPEGHAEESDAQTLLINVGAERLRLAGQRAAWAPDGHVAYSKICTHAGCPVGLYQTETDTLLCPCHQSTFDVLRAARPVFGPASRPLPQLPVEVDADGYFRALGDYPEPVGPAFWNRP